MSANPINSQSPVIGIDFGTTKTIVAEYDPLRKSAKVHKLGRAGDEMPTSIYVTPEEEVLFGDDADDEGLVDSLNHIRRFKMLLGKSTKTQFGKSPVTPIDLAATFLIHVRARLESEVFHRPVERLVLTVPAMFGPAQRNDLTIAARRAGFTRVELLAEPVAAGIAYCDHNTDLSSDLRFLVVDWGGGTFDLALVERNGADECRVLGEFVAGCSDIGGEDLDDELRIAVDRLVTDAGFQSLSLQPKHEWGKYRRELTRAKEGLTSRSQVPINFTLDGGKLARIPFSRAELEKVIANKVQIGARQVAELVERCRKNGSPPDFILLAGGTSRIPMIAKLLEQVAGLPCRAWSEGRDAIALGAAIHARRILDEAPSAPRSSLPVNTSLADKSLAKEVIQVNILGAKIGEIHGDSPDTSQSKIIDLIKEKHSGGGHRIFRGGCTNLTVEPPVSGEILLTINNQTGEKIEGHLEIFEPLGGGSKFSGQIKEKKICFLTRSDGFEIEWTGTFSDENIVYGSYIARTKDAKIKALYGADQKGVWSCCEVFHAGESSSPKQTPFRLSLNESDVGLRVFALAPKEGLQGQELIMKSHHVVTYLLRIENHSDKYIKQVRIFIKNTEGGRHSVIIPRIGNGNNKSLVLSSVNLEGWALNIGDTVTVDAQGHALCDLNLTEDACTMIDGMNSVNREIPCVIVLRKASFSSNFVLVITNIHKRKIKITEFTSGAGSLKKHLEIEPKGEVELGWLELDRNFNPGDEFRIKFLGFPWVHGVVAEGQLNSNGIIWKGLAAAGGLALAVLGGG